MRLVPKLTVGFIGVSALILAANGYFRVRRELATFEADRARDARVVGRALAGATAATLRTDGPDTARTMLAQAAAREALLRVRWVCADGAQPARASARCAALAALGADETRTLEDAPADDAWRFTYVPVIDGGGYHGALEVSEPLEPQARFARRAKLDTVRTALMLSAALAATAFLLGVWLVGRPTRALVEKARRVGTGDFGGPLALAASDEFETLADEMNAMCERLAAAAERIENETRARITALEQLRHADRLTTVGKLASGVAHELGTPLNVIEARASMIANGEAGAKGAEYARIIGHACERMTRIIEQLLVFARQRGPAKAERDLGELTRSACELLRPLAKKRGSRLAVEASDPGPRAAVEPTQIEQAVTNLVVNALDASRGLADAVVEVTVGTRRVTPPADMGGDEASYAVVAVRDHGAGIEPDDVPHVFEPFFTTKEVGEGTGLGLSVAHGIVRDHGGWIAVESRPGQGSLFEMFFPLVAQ